MWSSASRGLSLAFVALASSCSPRIDRKPLPSNPTAWEFRANVPQVHSAVRELYRLQFRERVRNAFHPSFAADPVLAPEAKEALDGDDVYVSWLHQPMGESRVYSVNGKPTEYLADFHLAVMPAGSLTRVEVRTIRPEIITGKTLMPRYHMQRATIYVAVAPTTIEEYAFLRKMGGVLGESGMPPLRLP